MLRGRNLFCTRTCGRFAERGATSYSLLSSAERHYSYGMIREWFDARESVAFARGIVTDINRLFPASTQKRKPASTKKDQKKFDSLVRRTRAFAQQHKLNIYKKAKLLNTIKWELRETGYDEALIDEIVAVLTPLLT
jgi:hypothetical protein